MSIAAPTEVTQSQPNPEKLSLRIVIKTVDGKNVEDTLRERLNAMMQNNAVAIQSLKTNDQIFITASDVHHQAIRLLETVLAEMKIAPEKILVFKSAGPRQEVSTLAEVASFLGTEPPARDAEIATSIDEFDIQ